jgi:hypothetical protein
VTDALLVGLVIGLGLVFLGFVAFCDWLAR